MMRSSAVFAALLATSASSVMADMAGAAASVPQDSNSTVHWPSSAPRLRGSALLGNTVEVASTSASSGAPLYVPTFFWNVHWQCSLGLQGSGADCKRKAGDRFVQLARAAKAQIVVSIELSDGESQPVSLIGLGLAGWSQVNGPCRNGHGDSAALAFSPGWRVEASGGGCLRLDSDGRAFAVARVTPPSPVQGCPSLCVLAVHSPHTAITSGGTVVSRVCGAAAASCTVAMGDWNAPADRIGPLWAALIGGAAPTLTAPNERTCCFPASEFQGVFDHVSTNVAGAGAESYVVHPNQITEENPLEQHNPVQVHLLLPAGR